MVFIYWIILLFSASYASRPQQPASEFKDLMNQFQLHLPTRSWEGHVHPLMMKLFQEKHASALGNSRTVRHSVRNDLTNKERKALRRSNTVRSLKCLESHKNGNVWNVRFDTTIVPTSEKISYAEIQIAGRQLTNDIKELRIKAGVITQSIRVARRRNRKNDKVKLDVTKQIRNIHTWNFNNKPTLDMSYTNSTSEDVSLIVFSRGEADAALSGISNAKPAERSRRDSTRPRSRRRKNRSRTKQFRRTANVDRKSLDERIDKYNPCRRVSFYVDFKKIGWQDWIIYPKIFQAYRCEGQCNVGTMLKQSPTNHAFLQGYFAVAKPELGIPEPCCVPSKLRPLSLLYFEKGEVVKRDHEEMVVEECGCS